MAKNFVPFTDAEERFIKKAVDKRLQAENKFPLLFSMFITFGFVSTLYGFEKLIDRIPLFVNHPWILLATGLITLMATGAVYKKLN